MSSTPSTGLRLAVVTNIPAPYRVPVYNRLAKLPGIALHAFYAAASEPDREWDLPPLEHEHTIMPGRTVERAGRYIHHNPQVGRQLQAFRPDVVLTTGFNPTHLAAWWLAIRHGIGHVAMTDGTDLSEARLSRAHRVVRRVVFARTRAFVVASRGGWRLLQQYGVDAGRIHVSPLCANTAVDWTAPAGLQRDIDLLFSARLVPIKNADLALRIAQGVARQLGRTVHMAVLGSGPEQAALQALADSLRPDVVVHFAGHVSQAAVPLWFQRSRVFLFPTRWDPWGVVANEACLAGVPVLVSPHAGVAGELIRDGVNGRVLPLELNAWIDSASQLLSKPDLLAQWSAAATRAVQPYNFDNAAAGMADAARQAFMAQSAPERLSTFRWP